MRIPARLQMRGGRASGSIPGIAGDGLGPMIQTALRDASGERLVCRTSHISRDEGRFGSSHVPCPRPAADRRRSTEENGCRLTLESGRWVVRGDARLAGGRTGHRLDAGCGARAAQGRREQEGARGRADVRSRRAARRLGGGGGGCRGGGRGLWLRQALCGGRLPWPRDGRPGDDNRGRARGRLPALGACPAGVRRRWERSRRRMRSAGGGRPAGLFGQTRQLLVAEGLAPRRPAPREPARRPLSST